MLSASFGKLIEDRAKQLTAGIVKYLQNNPRTQACHMPSHQSFFATPTTFIGTLGNGSATTRTTGSKQTIASWAGSAKPEDTPPRRVRLCYRFNRVPPPDLRPHGSPRE